MHELSLFMRRGNCEGQDIKHFFNPFDLFRKTLFKTIAIGKIYVKNVLKMKILNIFDVIYK